MGVIPKLQQNIIQIEQTWVSLNFTNGQYGNTIYSIVVYKNETEGRTITEDQIIIGLDSYNKLAVQQNIETFKENGQSSTAFFNLESDTEYIVYSVVINKYTSLSYATFSQISSSTFKTLKRNDENQDDEEEEESEEEERNDFGKLVKISIGTFLLSITIIQFLYYQISPLAPSFQ